MQLPEIDLAQLDHLKWVAYFDLLGSKKESETNLYEIYRSCLMQARRNTQMIDSVEIAYFSDTFLLYTPDDSKKSLNEIDHAACGFFDELIESAIPVRGAMSCNRFYADPLNGIYLGEALVEAYQLGEKYNWLGFVLHKSARDAMAKTGRVATDRGHYKEWKAEFKTCNACNTCGKRVVAYERDEVTAYSSLNNLQSLKNMASSVKDNHAQRKYSNSIEFIEATNPQVSWVAF